MRKSIVTWRLSFQSLPTAAQLDHVRELLAPIAKVDLAPDHGVTFREIGLSEHEFVAEPCELTPGELALACLSRAHRLAKGWSVMWPHSRGNPDKGWLAQEVY